MAFWKPDKKPDAAPVTCPTCAGKGFFTLAVDGRPADPNMDPPYCKTCMGAGKISAGEARELA